MPNPLWESVGASTAEWTNIFTAPSETVGVVAASGYLGAAFRIQVGTAAENEIGLRKELPAGARILQVRFKIDAAATFAPSGIHNLLHAWSVTTAAPTNQFASDILQLRLVSTATDSFKLRLVDPATGYTASDGTTVYVRNRWYKLILAITDTAFQVYVDQGLTPEVNFTGRTNTGKFFSAMSFGKFYSFVLSGAIHLDHVSVYPPLATAPTTNVTKNTDVYYGWKQRFRVPYGLGCSAVVRPYDEGFERKLRPVP